MTRTVERPWTALKAPPAPLTPEIENDLTRRSFLAGAAGLLLPAGFSGDGGNDEASGETRTIEHAMGETEVPAAPQRVVVIDSFMTLTTALMLDVPVVGATTLQEGQEPFLPFLDQEKTKDIESVGYFPPNIEAVAALEPDLIIGTNQFMEEPYDQLAQVAPAVAVEMIPQVEWKEDERKLGRVFGSPEEIESRISDYEARIEDFKTAMGDRLEELRITFIRIVSDEVRIHTRYHFAGAVLDEAGLRRPEDQWASDPEEMVITISEELIPRLDADVIFYATGGGGFSPQQAREAIVRYEDNSLWQRLRAVQNDRVYAVDPSYWLTGGVHAAGLILDDLEKYLLEETS